jgi:hypothetical protein
MITIQNRKTGETIQIDETNPKLLAKYGIKIPKSVKKMDLGGLGTFMSGIDNSVDTGDPMITEATSADSPINFPNILSGNNDIQRMGQGIKAIVDGTNNDNPAQAAAGVGKTALAGAMGGSRFFGNINQRKIAFGQENNNTFNQIDGLFAQRYLASNVNQGSNNNPATYAEGGFKQTNNMLNSGISKFTGKKHYEGGIPINTDQPFNHANDLKINRDDANLEVETGEYYVPMAKSGGAFVASDVNKLGRGGKSPAKLIEIRTKEETGISANKLTTKLSKREKFIDDNKSYLSNPLLNSTSESMSLLSVPLIEQHKIIAKEEVFAQEKKKRDMGKPNDFASLKYGGNVKKMPEGGKKDNDPTLSGTDVAGLEYFGGDLENVFSYAKSLGYNGTKNITDLQRFAVSLDPQGVSNYMEMVKPNNKAISLVNERRKKENLPALTPKEISEFSMTMLSPDERKEAFLDEKWDFRYPMIKKQNVSKPLNYLPKQERPSDPITPNNYPTNVAEGDKKGKRSNTLIPRIGNTYPIEPIQKLSLTPYDYTPNLINPQAQINEITRGNYIGNTSGRRSEKAQEFTNDYAAIQNIMGSVANQNTQLKNQASQINNTNRQNINQLNLGYGQTFMDNIAQRNAVVTQQQMIDNNAYTKALTDQNHEASTIEYLKTAYPTEFAAMVANQPIIKKLGGKIKLKPKKKK